MNFNGVDPKLGDKLCTLCDSQIYSAKCLIINFISKYLEEREGTLLLIKFCSKNVDNVQRYLS